MQYPNEGDLPLAETYHHIINSLINVLFHLKLEDAIVGDDWNGILEPKRITFVVKGTSWPTPKRWPHFPLIRFELVNQGWPVKNVHLVHDLSCSKAIRMVWASHLRAGRWLLELELLRPIYLRFQTESVQQGISKKWFAPNRDHSTPCRGDQAGLTYVR
jgi:hypothetical protein